MSITVSFIYLVRKFYLSHFLIHGFPPQPGLTFPTFEEAKAFIERFAANHHTILSLFHTRKSNENVYLLATFVCEKYGSYRGKKKIGFRSKKTECPFAIRVNYRSRNNVYVITSVHLEHNHVLLPEASVFSTGMRKLTVDDCALTEMLDRNAMRTKDVIPILADVTGRYIHKADVYNAVSRSRRRKLQGLTEVELLIKCLCDDPDIVAALSVEALNENESDQDGAFLRGMFWAYRSSLRQFSQAADLLVVDATYKTNRFSMPLVVVCAVDRFGSTYLIALALIHGETVPYYTWVMRRLFDAMVEVCGIACVNTFMTDRELALMKAIHSVFPDAHHQVYLQPTYLFATNHVVSWSSPSLTLSLC